MTRRDIVEKQFKNLDFNEFIDDLSREIRQRNYRITRINNIDNIHDRKTLVGQPEVRFLHYKIIEFCNLNSCAELISAELLAGVFMPVRFSVYQPSASQQISAAFLRPTAFAGLFNTTASPLLKVAKELEKDMLEILDELDF